MREPNKTAIFSGRYDPPHLGHIHTILKIAKVYGRVIVVILDYSERKTCTAEEARDIFESIFEAMYGQEIGRNVFQVAINNIHFAKITFSEYDLFLRSIGVCYNHSIYLSGNEEVLKNMKQQGIKHRFFSRTDDYIYSGTKIRKQIDDGVKFEEFMPVTRVTSEK